jgi:hypothetical protein
VTWQDLKGTKKTTPNWSQLELACSSSSTKALDVVSCCRTPNFKADCLNSRRLDQSYAWGGASCGFRDVSPLATYMWPSDWTEQQKFYYDARYGIPWTVKCICIPVYPRSVAFHWLVRSNIGSNMYSLRPQIHGHLAFGLKVIFSFKKWPTL